jgi:hypothetical protein
MKLIKIFYSLLDAKYEAIELMEILSETDRTQYYDVTNIKISVYSLTEAVIDYNKGNGRGYWDRQSERVYYNGLKRLLPFTFIIDLTAIKLKHKLLKENAQLRKLDIIQRHYSNKTTSYAISAKAVKKLKNKGIFVTFKEPKDMV